MKKLIASFVAVGLLVGLSIWWRGYAHDVVQLMYEEIDEAIAVQNENDIEGSMAKIDEVKDQWEQSEGVLALFLSHIITDGIDLNFERARSFAERGGTIDALTELRTARHLLHDLERSLEISIRNIM